MVTSNVFFKNGQGRLAMINGQPVYHGMTLRVFGQDCSVVSARPQGVGFRYTVLTPEGKAVELNAKDIAAFKATVRGGEAETMFRDKEDWFERVSAWDGLRIETGADGVDRAVAPTDVIVGEYGPHYHLFLESYVRDVLKLERRTIKPMSADDEAEIRLLLSETIPAAEAPMDSAPVQAIEANPEAAERVEQQAAKSAPATTVDFDGLDGKVVQALAEYAGLDSLGARYDELVRKKHLSEEERQLLCKKLRESGYVGAREHAGRTFPVYKDDPTVLAKSVPNAKSAGLKDRGDAVAVYLRAATNPAELRDALAKVGFPGLDVALAQYAHLSFGLLKMSMTNRLRKLVATGVVAPSSVRPS